MEGGTGRLGWARFAAFALDPDARCFAIALREGFCKALALEACSLDFASVAFLDFGLLAFGVPLVLGALFPLGTLLAFASILALGVLFAFAWAFSLRLTLCLGFGPGICSTLGP